MTEGPPQLRRSAALTTVRSVLGALILVALFGSIAAVVSYRADVTEARRQVQARVAQQGRLYADSLALHFDVLEAELQRLADRGFQALAGHDETVLTTIRDDRALFTEGVALLDLHGAVVWSEPALAFPADVQLQPWFQHVLGLEKSTVDELKLAGQGEDSSRLAVALPVLEDGKLAGLLVGVVGSNDRLLYGVAGPGEQLLLLSSRGEVILPVQAPAWSSSTEFQVRFSALKQQHDEPTMWDLQGQELIAEAFGVKETSLQVLAVEDSDVTTAPIRRRLNFQLFFLLVVQLAALGAFVLFLRRTWRAFLEAEERFAQREKMAALGDAASLIAHEVKNSLNGLSAATSLLERGGDAALVSRTVTGQVERLGHLARSLLSFSRPTETRRVSVQLDALTRDTVNALHALPEWPEAKVELALEPVQVDSDPLLLTTAIDNLVRNAIEAAVLAKDVGQVATPQVRVIVKREGERAVVQVEDNARAPAELEQRLGQPFFTTKPRGIGLGLAMTQKAMEELGGTLRFERLEGGSRFQLTL
ncbi:MAG: ATP-binding protein [Myxococcaceae bacterium]